MAKKGKRRMKSARDPDALLHDQLLKLRESEGWQIYRGIIDAQYKELATGLIARIATPEQMAAHNQLVGTLLGMRKTLLYLDAKIEELEIKEKMKQARAEGIIA